MKEIIDYINNRQLIKAKAVLKTLEVMLPKKKE